MGVLELVLDVLLSASAQALELFLDFLLLELLAVLFDCQLLLETTAGVQLADDGTHFDNKNYRRQLDLEFKRFSNKIIQDDEHVG